VLANPLPDGPDTLEPPSQKLLDLFWSSTEDELETKPVCVGEGVGGFSTLECRDPNSYVKGNEPRGYLFRPYLQGRSGGYVGVGSDQNYTYAAEAKSTWAWFMDYDPNVVYTHRVNRVLIGASETPEAFVARYSAGQMSESVELIAEFYEGDPLKDLYVRTYRGYRAVLERFYLKEITPQVAHRALGNVLVQPGPDDYGWLRNAESYAWIRMLWQQDRAQAVKGDMLGTVGMQSIGHTAHAMKIPIRLYYTSNAPNAWGGKMTTEYRSNVRGLPMDEHSLVIQTLGFATGFGQEGYWHHNVQGGFNAQERLNLDLFRTIVKMVDFRIPGDDPDLTVVGVRGP
jgi:hypothetical protein